MDEKTYVPIDSLPSPDPEKLYPQLINPQVWKSAAKEAVKTASDAQKASLAGQDILQSAYATNHLLDLAAKNDPFLKTGAWFGQRTDVMNAIETLKQSILGLPQDTHVLEQIGVDQALNKLSTRAGFDLARTLGTREAMQVIQQALQAVANGNMSPAGAKMILHNVIAGAQRNIDRAQYYNLWRDNTGHRTLVGAEDYFNKDVGPVSKYVDRAERGYALDLARLKANPEQEKTLKEQAELAGFSPEMYGY